MELFSAVAHSSTKAVCLRIVCVDVLRMSMNITHLYWLAYGQLVGHQPKAVYVCVCVCVCVCV